MKNIVTAIGNPMLNKKLKALSDYHILANDITSDEELIELIERENEIDVLFLCSNIIKNYSVDEYLTIIKKIQKDVEIIFFKNQKLEINTKEAENLKIYTELDIEMEKIKEILENSVSNSISKNIGKTIAISGAHGVGKSIFSTLLAKNVDNENVKTLLIDFNLDENQLRTIMKIKKKPQNSQNIEDFVINIHKNLDLIAYLDFLYDEKTIDYFKVKEMLDNWKQSYNLIIIDTSANMDNEYTKQIFYNSDEILFLVEPNILGVKKANRILEILVKDWRISEEKIRLILNKVNMYQISDSVLEELFPDFKIVGKVKYNDTYNLIINKNINRREIKKEYEKIYKKIECLPRT